MSAVMALQKQVRTLYQSVVEIGSNDLHIIERYSDMLSAGIADNLNFCGLFRMVYTEHG